MPRRTALSGLSAMMQSASVPRLRGPGAMTPDKEAGLVSCCHAPSLGRTWRGSRTLGALSALEGPETETVEQPGHELLALRAGVTARVLSHQPGLVGVAGSGSARNNVALDV